MPKLAAIYRVYLRGARGAPWPSSRPVRRAVIAVVGGLLLALGLLLIPLPGPGLLVIPLGIAVLAVEFDAVRRGFRSLRRALREKFPRMRTKRNGS